MAFQIIWTRNAIEDYKNVVDYLLTEWPLKLSEDFIAVTEKRVELLKSFPYIGIASSKDPRIHSIIITKHNKLYYRVSDSMIEILNIFDTRKNLVRNIYE